MTTQEKAKQTSTDIIDWCCGKNSQLDENYPTHLIEELLKNQHKIDIDKAIEWLDKLLDGRPFLADGWQDDLRNAIMEE